MEHNRLVRALTRQGILSKTEAEACITAFREKREYCCEAVNHYGGVRRLMRDAIRYRNVGRVYRRDVVAAYQERRPCPCCRRRGRIFAHPDWCMVWSIPLEVLNGETR